MLVPALIKVLLQDMLLACEVARSMFMVVLQRMPSPLEMCACIVVVDGRETEHGFQIGLVGAHGFQHMLGSVRVSNKHYPQDRILIKYVNLQILYAINIVTVAKIQCQRH